mmetsp:Transcript_7791/g.24311  ORF Transcript_7791/g.24311 Transcript_7791/m.24311 type:complete len:251 (+) Transcript_7791:493-1245(+)
MPTVMSAMRHASPMYDRCRTMASLPGSGSPSAPTRSFFSARSTRTRDSIASGSMPPVSSSASSSSSSAIMRSSSSARCRWYSSLAMLVAAIATCSGSSRRKLCSRRGLASTRSMSCSGAATASRLSSAPMRRRVSATGRSHARMKWSTPARRASLISRPMSSRACTTSSRTWCEKLVKSGSRCCSRSFSSASSTSSMCWARNDDAANGFATASPPLPSPSPIRLSPPKADPMSLGAALSKAPAWRILSWR